MEEGVSVIICCYNSAKKLPKTIKHLAEQHLEELIPWEIIVVNNNSSDGTEEVALNEWNKYNSSANFLIIDQPIPGLSNARKMGIEYAKYNIVIFCDDDNWLDKDYIKYSFQIMRSDPRIGALGGVGFPVYEFEPPEWIDNYSKYLALGPQSKSKGEISSNLGHLYGAGMVVRKKAYQQVQKMGLIGMLSGRTGNSLSSGEDTELCYALTLTGNKIYYDPNLKFRHFITSDRLNKEYIGKLIMNIRASWVLLNPYIYKLRGLEVGRSTWLKDLIYLCLNTFKLIFLCFLGINKKKFISKTASIKAEIKAIQFLFNNKRQYERLITILNKN